MHMHMQVAEGSIGRHRRERDERDSTDNEQVTGLKFKVVEAQARTSYLFGYWSASGFVGTLTNDECAHQVLLAY